MNARYLIASVAGLGLFTWVLLRAPGPELAAQAAPVMEAPRPGSLGQASWFSSAPQWSAGMAGPQVRAAQEGVAFYGRNGRTINLGGLTVARYVAARIGAARSGDIKAAYEAYQAASICAANDDPVTDFGHPAEREEFLLWRAVGVKLCEGMTPAQVQERMGFLTTAARAGNIGAQVDFYMEGPYGRHLDMAENANDPTVKQWKQDAIGYLKQAGAKCDPFALGLLSTVYDAGQLTERDLRMAMAYSIAAAVPAKKVVTEQQLRERYGEELPPAEFASAMQLGAQLSAQACPAR